MVEEELVGCGIETLDISHVLKNIYTHLLMLKLYLIFELIVLNKLNS